RPPRPGTVVRDLGEERPHVPHLRGHHRLDDPVLVLEAAVHGARRRPAPGEDGHPAETGAGSGFPLFRAPCVIAREHSVLMPGERRWGGSEVVWRRSCCAGWRDTWCWPRWR